MYSSSLSINWYVEKKTYAVQVVQQMQIVNKTMMIYISCNNTYM